jgi:hypothetical protein
MAISEFERRLVIELRQRTERHGMGASQVALRAKISEGQWQGLQALNDAALDRWCQFLLLDSTTLWLEVAGRDAQS